MPTVFKEVQEDADIRETSDEMQGERPDVMIEHGSTRVSLDLSPWEWLILAAVIIVLAITSSTFEF